MKPIQVLCALLIVGGGLGVGKEIGSYKTNTEILAQCTNNQFYTLNNGSKIFCIPEAFFTLKMPPQQQQAEKPLVQPRSDDTIL